MQATWDPSISGWAGNVVALFSVGIIGLIVCYNAIRQERLLSSYNILFLLLVFVWWNWLIGTENTIWVMLGVIVTNQLLPRKWIRTETKAPEPSKPNPLPSTKKIQAGTSSRRVRDWYKIPSGLGDKRSDLFVPNSNTKRITVPTNGYELEYPNVLSRPEDAPDFISDEEIDVIEFDGEFAFVHCPTCKQKIRGAIKPVVKIACPKCYVWWIQRLR